MSDTTMLKLWYNDSDWVVASDPDDAWRVLEEVSGMRPVDYGVTDESERREFWMEQTRDLAMPEHDEQPLAEAPRKTPAEIVAQHGRGYVGSSEW